MKIAGTVQMVTPNKLHLLESKEDQFYWKQFKDYLIPAYEADLVYVVIQEDTHFDSKSGARISVPKVAKYNIAQWQDLTKETPQSRTKYGGGKENTGLNPLAGLRIEIINDPTLEVKKPKKVSGEKAPVDPEPQGESTIPEEITLEFLEGKDDDQMKAIYRKVFGKGSGRMSAEKVREKIVNEIGND